MTCVQPGASCAGCSDTGDQGDTNTNLVCSNTYKVTSSLYTIYTYKVTSSIYTIYTYKVTTSLYSGSNELPLLCRQCGCGPGVRGTS